MALSLPHLKDIIDSGRFDQLVGEVEGQFLDVKEQPYQFSAGFDAKRELAKDVSAFANTSGGYILIGLPTKRSETHSGEEILEPRPIPKAQFDADQYRKILSEWLHPQPTDMFVGFVQNGSDLDKGIGVVFVPPQDVTNKPFLITRELGDKKSTGLLFSYVERRLDATRVFSVMELQQALRTGMNFERELLGRIQTLESLIQRHFSFESEARATKQLDEVVTNRIAETLNREIFQSVPALVICAMPTDNTELFSIFSDQPDGIRRKLETPPRLRRSGWGFATGAPARTVQGKFIRVDSDCEVIDLYRDGCLVFAGAISSDFLAWGKGPSRKIHPLALIEVLINFTKFFQCVIDDLRKRSQQFKITIVVKDMLMSNVNRAVEHVDYRVSLPHGETLHQRNFQYAGNAPEDFSRWCLTIEGDWNPERIAFQIARELYVWFGLAEEDIPYTTGVGDNRVIDSAKIEQIK